MAEFTKQVALEMGIEFDSANSGFTGCSLEHRGVKVIRVNIDDSLETVALGIPVNFATTEQILKGLRAWKA